MLTGPSRVPSPVDERASLNVAPEVRDELRDLLFHPEMKGVGYTEFVKRAIDAAKIELAPPCEAMLFHGPGHQSKTRCSVKGPHDVHACYYGGNEYAEWRDGQYTDRLRADGVDFDPDSYPENMAMTGFFDEPPEVV